MARQYTIVDGPSREELMDHFRRDGQNGQSRVWFRVSYREGFHRDCPENFLQIMICSLEREDGSGHCWNFRGDGHLGTPQVGWRVDGFYSTKTRKGTLTVL